MGIKSGFRKVSQALFNFRLDLWLDYKSLKATTQYYHHQFRNLYHIDPPADTETFAEAQQRLNLTSEFLHLQSQRYRALMAIYLVIASCLSVYCLWLTCSGNFMGALMTLAIILYALSFAFRYHFWNYQIQKRKLACSLTEWLQDLLNTKRKLKRLKLQKGKPT